MMASRPDYRLACPTQAELDAFQRLGIDIMALATPVAMQVAVGSIAANGLFEPEGDGARWFAFPEIEADDIVFWHRTSGQMASWCGRVFALGEEIIGEPATYSFDCALNIFDSPLDWLRAKRDGIVVLDWERAFDRLRDCPRIAIAEGLLSRYRQHMKPAHLPELLVIPSRRSAA